MRRLRTAGVARVSGAVGSQDGMSEPTNGQKRVYGLKRECASDLGLGHRDGMFLVVTPSERAAIEEALPQWKAKRDLARRAKEAEATAREVERQCEESSRRREDIYCDECGPEVLLADPSDPASLLATLERVLLLIPAIQTRCGDPDSMHDMDPMGMWHLLLDHLRQEARAIRYELLKCCNEDIDAMAQRFRRTGEWVGSVHGTAHHFTRETMGLAGGDTDTEGL